MSADFCGVVGLRILHIIGSELILTEVGCCAKYESTDHNSVVIAVKIRNITAQ